MFALADMFSSRTNSPAWVDGEAAEDSRSVLQLSLFSWDFPQK